MCAKDYKIRQVRFKLLCFYQFVFNKFSVKLRETNIVYFVPV